MIANLLWLTILGLFFLLGALVGRHHLAKYPARIPGRGLND